jgi:DNA polymerase III sliding clamp (beta) subunit (PCNA family)
MLAELKFVQGSVAKKDFLPALTHFRIEGGTVRGYNGTLALCSPIPLDLVCTPRADALVRAIANCDESVTLALTPAGRLAVRSGVFKAFIDCVEGETPHVEPEGDEFDIDGDALLKGLKALQPFVSDDASRPWSNGILVRGQSAFATNNVVLVEYWLGVDFPEYNIPRAAIKEIVRIGEAPIGAQANTHSLTFHYAGGRWIRTNLLETAWPDLAKVLNVPSKPTAVDPQIFAGLKVIKPFVDKIGRVLFHEGRMVTHDSTDEGASFECTAPLPEGIYSIDMLALLEDVATTADWSLYPRPAMFFGDRLRGAIVGMRGAKE